jgi:hypothetical protein
METFMERLTATLSPLVAPLLALPGWQLLAVLFVICGTALSLGAWALVVFLGAWWADDEGTLSDEWPPDGLHQQADLVRRGQEVG